MKQTWTTRDFRLQSGDVLPELTLAYESYGHLAAGGRNAASSPTASPPASTPPASTTRPTKQPAGGMA